MSVFEAAGVRLDRHAFGWITAIVVVGGVLRFLLAWHSPQPFGYVYDFYHEPIVYMARTHHYPRSTAFWQGYHPPLFYLLGFVAFQLGQRFGHPLQGISCLAMLCGLITIGYGWKMLRLYQQEGRYLVLGTALLFVFPCLFISSWGAEADILLTALMSGFIYHTLAFHRRGYHATWTTLLTIGCFAGLAAATKYSGLLALVIFGLLSAVRFIAGPARRPALRDALVVLGLAVALSCWKYYDNYVTYHNLLYANGSAQQGFSLHGKRFFLDRYELGSFRLGATFALFSPGSPRLQLTEFPVYSSVWTALHAQAWGDMSFFSDPSRHGTGLPIYPFRFVPLWLIELVLIGAILPNLLALTGLVATLRQHDYWPLALIAATTLAAYLFWVLAQESWALKTKYILFLLPLYVVYVLAGIRWLQQRMPAIVVRATAVGLTGLIVLAHFYLYEFAVGG